MVAYAYPITALKTAVETMLAADAGASAVAPHFFGSKYLEQNDAPPRYVWVPTRSREVKPTLTRAVDEPVVLASDAEQFQVWCWGQSFDQAWAMRHNLRRAVQKLAKSPNTRNEGGEWRRPSAAWNQLGEIYIVELSLTVPVFDQPIDIGALTYPNEHTVEISQIDGDVRVTTDLDDEGESYVTTSTG